MTKILFICHGNICRSPMAEYIFKNLIKQAGLGDSFEIASAATSREELGNDIYPPAKDVLRRHGVPFESRSARQISARDMEYYDYVVAMEGYNVANLKRLLPSANFDKVHLLMSFAGKNSGVADPWYSGDFEKTYDNILEGCRGLLEKAF